MQQHVDLEAGPRLRLGLSAQERGRLHHTGAGPARTHSGTSTSTAILSRVPRTLLVDSEQPESGQALDRNFRAEANDEIERFRDEIIKRTGDRWQAENLSDQDLLCEVMNTVGKAGRLNGDTRCVVSVSMLTEGWDASTVTHALGVRAFGTQLLCE